MMKSWDKIMCLFNALTKTRVTLAIRGMAAFWKLFQAHSFHQRVQIQIRPATLAAPPQIMPQLFLKSPKALMRSSNNLSLLMTITAMAMLLRKLRLI